jgi:hypothetical protein
MVKDNSHDSLTDHPNSRQQRKIRKRPALKTNHSRAPVDETAHTKCPHGAKADKAGGPLDVSLQDGDKQPKRPWLTVLIDRHTRKIIHFDLRLEEEVDR